MSVENIDWDNLKAALLDMEEDMNDEFDDIEDAEDDAEFGDSFMSDFETMMGYREQPDQVMKPKAEDIVRLGRDNSKDSEDPDIYVGEIITDDDVLNNAHIIYPKTKIYRSIIRELFTPDQMIELEKLSRTFSITNNQKIDIIKEKLEKWGIPFSSLGGGTNRYGFMVDGYVIKVACDKDGKIDNKREFIYSMPLQPYVVKCYETVADGLMAVFEYVTIFGIDDYWSSQDKMRRILTHIANDFLVGDVGISSKNYVNWGYREDGEPVILDFAYIYSVQFKVFTCACGEGSILYYDKDFNHLICPTCGKKYTFGEIRKKISRKEQDEEIGDLMEKGYVIDEPEQECEFKPQFVLGAFDAIKKKLIKLQKRQNQRNKINKKSTDWDNQPVMEFDEILENIAKGRLK